MTREIETKRLLLRPHVAGDFDELAALWGDARVTRWIGGKPSTREESWARLLRYIGHWDALGFGFFAVIDKATGQFAGDVGLADFQRDMTPSLAGLAEAGWVLRPALWGHGLASEALAAVLDWYAVHGQPARKLACIISPGNTASLRVAEKSGFGIPVEAVYKGEAILVLRRD